MISRLFPFMLLVAILAGCDRMKKKTDDIVSDIGASMGTTYTISLRDEREGDKTAVTKSESMTTTGTTTAPGKSATKEQKMVQRFEYTETVVAMPAGAARPTKLTRLYQVAEQTAKDGKAKPLSFQGKTVTIESKAGGPYTFKTEGGKAVPAQDAAALASEFRADNKTRAQDLVPKTAVKVGDPWVVDAAAVKALAAEIGLPVALDASKVTGTLTRAYKKGDRQWGVIDFKLDFVFGGANAPPGSTGTQTGEISLDVPIDGSGREGTTKIKMKRAMTVKSGQVENQTTIDVTREETITPAK